MCDCVLLAPSVNISLVAMLGTDRNLRSNKPLSTASNVIDDTSVTQKVLENLLLSEDFINKISSKISENLIPSLQTEVKRLNEEVSSLKTSLVEANMRIEHLEQYSRANNLRIFGVKEQEKEDVNNLVVNMCNEKLGISITTSDIDVAHRLKSKENGIRPIIVRFLHRSTKKNIYNSKKKLKGSKVVIKEDLTSYRVSLLKKLASCSPKTSYWTNNGKVFSKRDNTVYPIQSLSDIEKIWCEESQDPVGTTS